MSGERVLTKVTRNGQVTLPKAIRERIGISEGDLVEVAVEDERLILTPKRLIDASQAYFWSREWQDGERQASQDIAEGDIAEFDCAEDLIQSLHRTRQP